MTDILQHDRFVDEIRRYLISNNLGSLLSDPRLVEIINTNITRWKEDNHEAERLRADYPPDGGLLNLAGLGDDGVEDLADARHAPQLPRFDEQVTSERIIGAGDLYYLYQHEKLGVFRAVLKLQELFKAGRVKLSEGDGAIRLYQFDRQKVLRYTRRERMQAYRRVFGYTDAQLPAAARPNTEFHKLFTNFSNVTAQYYRDQRVSEVIRTGGGPVTFGSVAVVRRAGLDLRNNLKGATYGNVNVLRTEVMLLLEHAFEILDSEDVRNLYGADDGWDVIEDIKRRELNEPSRISQRSRMAQTGHDILDWIAGPDILTTNGDEFQLRISIIRDAVEEWLTSAESVGAKSEKRPSSSKVVPFERRMTL